MGKQRRPKAIKRISKAVIAEDLGSGVLLTVYKSAVPILHLEIDALHAWSVARRKTTKGK